MLLFNLGLLGAALAGGIKGAGTGMVQLADEETERLKQERIQEFRLKENEQTARLHYDLGDRNAANQQNRGLLDYAAKKKIDIGMATDPNNVKAATEAELQAQQAKDQYSDKRFPTKLSQEQQMFNVKNPLEKEKIQSQIDENKAQIANLERSNIGGDSTQDIEYLKVANSAIEKKLEFVSNMPEETPEQKIEKNKASIAVKQEMDSLQTQIMAKAGIQAQQTQNLPAGDISADEIRKIVLDEGKPKEPSKTEELAKKGSSMLGNAINTVKQGVSGAGQSIEDAYTKQAAMFLKYGPSGSKYDADLVRIRDDKTLSQEQKVQKIAAYLKDMQTGNSGSLKSTVSDYGRLLGL